MWADCVSLIVQPGLFWSTVLCRSSGLGFQSWSSTQRSPVPWSPSRWQAPHNSDLPLTKKGTLYNSWNNWWKDYKKKKSFYMKQCKHHWGSNTQTQEMIPPVRETWNRKTVILLRKKSLSVTNETGRTAMHQTFSSPKDDLALTCPSQMPEIPAGQKEMYCKVQI